MSRCRLQTRSQQEVHQPHHHDTTSGAQTDGCFFTRTVLSGQQVWPSLLLLFGRCRQATSLMPAVQRPTLCSGAPPGLPIKAHVNCQAPYLAGTRRQMCRKGWPRGPAAARDDQGGREMDYWHVFCGDDDPAGPIFKDDKLVDYEERHLRNDNTKPGAVTAPDPACPLQRKLVMDAVAKSCTSRTALRNGSSASSPDQIMHDGEAGDKFSADSRSLQSLPTSTSMRFIPLASNQFGRRGWHFEALLLELSFHIVHKPSGCRLMQGMDFCYVSRPGISIFYHIRRCWGARLTWTTQRAHML